MISARATRQRSSPGAVAGGRPLVSDRRRGSSSRQSVAAARQLNVNCCLSRGLMGLSPTRAALHGVGGAPVTSPSRANLPVRQDLRGDGMMNSGPQSDLDGSWKRVEQ